MMNREEDVEAVYEDLTGSVFYLPKDKDNVAVRGERWCGGEFVELQDGSCANCNAPKEKHMQKKTCIPESDRNQVDITVAPGSGAVDEVTAFWQDFDLGKGQVTLHCYGSAWTAYFGGMGDQKIRDFFQSCGSDYLSGKLGSAQTLKPGKVHQDYLRKVISSVQKQLAKELRQKVKA